MELDESITLEIAQPTFAERNRGIETAMPKDWAKTLPPIGISVDALCVSVFHSFDRKNKMRKQFKKRNEN